MSEKKINRRSFLAASAAASSLTILPGGIIGQNASPNAKLNIAGIGIGGMGSNNLRNMESENIVALCDVDHAYAANTFNRYPNAKRYKDYRVMLEKEKNIDAVLIATPDHSHAKITIDCMRAGKHVYCQKPLTHTPYEARKVKAVAKETGVVTQMGIQGHSADGISTISEWIWSGAIGKVEQVDAWCSLTYYPPNQAYWCTSQYSIPNDKPPVPETLDWDLWIGPVQYRDYHPTYHPARWRAWYDFGCGWMGDRGVHTLDIVYATLKLNLPEVVSASASDINDQVHPVASIVKFYFGKRDDMPPVELTWYEGLEVPRPIELEDGRDLPSEGGILFKGEKGTIMCGIYGDSPRIIPEAKMQEFKQPKKTIARINTSHEMNWVEAIKLGGKATADFQYSADLTEFVLLGNYAKRTRSKLYYDAVNARFTNNDQANALMNKQYRPGWEV